MRTIIRSGEIVFLVGGKDSVIIKIVTDINLDSTYKEFCNQFSNENKDSYISHFVKWLIEYNMVEELEYHDFVRSIWNLHNLEWLAT